MSSPSSRNESHDPARVLVGCYEIAGFVDALGEGFRALGNPVTTAISVGLTYYRDRPYDAFIGRDVNAVDWRALGRHLERGGPVHDALDDCSTSFDRLAYLIARHDVFVFVHASFHHDHKSAYPRMGIGREYGLLKRLGKKIVSFLTGPDVRHVSAYDAQHELQGLRLTSLGRIVPDWNEDPLARPLRNLRRTELHADVIYSQPNQSGLALRPYQHLFAPLNLSRYAFRIPRRQVPVIVHAPSDRDTKGTAIVLASLERLRRRDIRFELRLLDGVPHREVQAALADADVVIDQIHLPLHGRLGVEAMASGCALAGCDRASIEPIPANRPIFHLEPQGIDERLGRLLGDRALRIRLAEEGREHVVRYHDHRAVAARVLRDLAAGPSLRCDHQPDFFANHYRLRPGELVPSYLARVGTRLVRRHGLPAGVDEQRLRRRGLIA